jgi:cytochrome P450
VKRGANALLCGRSYCRAFDGGSIASVETSFSNSNGWILTIFLAGEDTTANTLAWMMYLMAQHPQVQRQMQAEADRVLGSAERAPTYESTAGLRYIEATAQETMRLLPVAPLQGAEPIEDTLIGDVWVPKGTPIYMLAGRQPVYAVALRTLTFGRVQ